MHVKHSTFSSINFGFLWFSFRIGYNELVAALQQLQGQLNKHGLASLAGRVTSVQGLLLGPVVARALHIRSAVLQRRRPRTQNAIRSDAKALAKEVSVLILFIFLLLLCILLTHKFCFFIPSLRTYSKSIWNPDLIETYSVLSCWLSLVHQMPSNFAIYNRPTKWKGCLKRMI